MPPKGTKRLAERAAPEQSASKKHGVTKAEWNSFVDGLSESCREMVLGMLPEPGAVPSAARMDGIREVATRVSIEMTEKELTELDARDSEVTGTLEGIEATLTKAKETALGQRNVLAQATRALTAKEVALEEKRFELSEVQAQFKQSVEDKTLLKKAFVDVFQKFEAGDLEAHQTKQLYDTAMAVHEKLILDESQKTVLPPSLQKQPAEWGQCENMVVLQFCWTKIQELAKVVEECGAPEAARRAAVIAAQNELNVTWGKQLEAAHAFAVAHAGQEKAQKTVDDTHKTLASFALDRQNLVAFKRELDTQRVRCFTALIRRTLETEEVNEAAEVAQAETQRIRRSIAMIARTLETEDANEEAEAEQAQENQADLAET